MQLSCSTSLSIIRQIFQSCGLHTAKVFHLQACCKKPYTYHSRSQAFRPLGNSGRDSQPGIMVLNSWQRSRTPVLATGDTTIEKTLRVLQLRQVHLKSTRHAGAQSASSPPASALTIVAAQKSIQHQQTGSKVLPRTSKTASQASNRRSASLTCIMYIATGIVFRCHPECPILA